MNKLYNCFNLYEVGFISKLELLDFIHNLTQQITYLDVETIKKIVNYEENNTTALIKAIKTEDLEVIQAMFNLPNLDINYQTKNLNCALLESLTHDDNKSLLYLLNEPELNLEIKFKHNQDFAYHLAYNNKFDILRNLIENHNLDYQNEDKKGQNILHAVAASSNLQMLHYFIEKNIDINKISSDGKTPIDIAIERENIDFVNLLLPLIDISKHTHSFKESIFLSSSILREIIFNSNLCNIESLTSFLEDDFYKGDKDFILFEEKIKDKLQMLIVLKEKEKIETNIQDIPQLIKKLKI